MPSTGGPALNSRRPLAVRLLDRRREGAPVEVVLLAVAYLSAVASLLAYVVVDGGTGMPSRLELVLMGVPIGIFLYLSLRSAPG